MLFTENVNLFFTLFCDYIYSGWCELGAA